ncbi:gp436 family protein [Neisseria leonii]|uniref:gp436 family protein n=1 Tax=Neisseria leonii TaxID=2995413 RepID=UPI00237AE887|nr:phage protein Gp36 family protein [Neisseria sp. 3986]MDD9325617.1 DUF1320 family protein [Neisseria sp. 3986]
MAYADVADMVERFGELEMIEMTDRNHSGTVNREVASVALADAGAEIDAYLGRFRRPFDETPPILKRLCCDIARYRLTAANGVLITEEIRNRYHIDVLNLLKALAKGEVQLGGADGETGQAETADSGVMFTNAKNRIFARDYPDRAAD